MPEPLSRPFAYEVPPLAVLLGVSRQHLYNLIAQGDLPAIHLGKRVLVPAWAVEALLRGNAGDAA